MRTHTSVALTAAALLSLAACASTTHHTTVVVTTSHPAVATSVPVPTRIATVTPSPSHTVNLAKPSATVAYCHIRTAAGNCFSAGQSCPAATAGRTTTDMANKPITCSLVKGRYVWKRS